MFEKIEYQLPNGDWASVYRRPRWFGLLFGNLLKRSFCVELFGKIWVDPEVELIEWAKENHEVMYHERRHAAQQLRVGELKWYFKYVFSKSFRLDAEAEAYAVSLNHIAPETFPIALNQFATWLAGPEYRFAASSIAQAQLLILKYHTEENKA